MSTTTKKFVGTLGGRKFKKHSYLDAFRELLDTIVAARLKVQTPKTAPEKMSLQDQVTHDYFKHLDKNK